MLAYWWNGESVSEATIKDSSSTSVQHHLLAPTVFPLLELIRTEKVQVIMQTAEEGLPARAVLRIISKSWHAERTRICTPAQVKLTKLEIPASMLSVWLPRYITKYIIL